jgi:Flp pilus assembly protein TadD
LGRNEEAIDCFNIALEIEPNNVNLFNEKGIALADLGRNEEAIDCDFADYVDRL